MVDTSSFRHLYPFQSHFLDINGHRYHYVDEGQGEVLIMLHGNPTWSFYWRNLITHFSKKYRVIAPDHMGCGLSDKPQKYPYTLSTHIENLEKLITHLNLSNITLFMHDWGAPIGMGYATQFKHHVRRFVVFNSAAFLDFESRLKLPLRIKLCSLPIFGDIVIRLFNAFARGALLMAIHHQEKLTPDVKAGYLAPYNSFKNRVANLRFVQDIPWHPAIPSYSILEKITYDLSHFKNYPMIIIWGEKDFCFTHRFLMAWEDFFPYAYTRLISDADHYVVEDAYERIIPWVENFLKQNPL